MRKWEIIHQTGWNMWEFSWGLHMELVSYKLVVVHEYHESKSISIRTAPSDVCSIMPPFFCRIWRRQCLPIISGNVVNNCYPFTSDEASSFDGISWWWRCGQMISRNVSQTNQSIQSISPHFSTSHLPHLAMGQTQENLYHSLSNPSASFAWSLGVTQRLGKLHIPHL